MGNKTINYEKSNSLSLSLNKLKRQLRRCILSRSLYSQSVSYSPDAFAVRRTVSQKGFTIVELLVVIVVIGILAAITIVAYRGISGKAIEASLQSDLSSASRQLKLFQVENGAYPDTISCAIPDSSTNKCLKASGSNAFTYPAPNNSSSPQTFTLDATNGTTVYRITNDSTPTDVTTTPITAIAAISGTTTAIGNTLTAGALTPSGATVTYQWQSATTSGGTYTDITGATASTYTLIVSDFGKYIKVVATGTGSYAGTQTSAASAVVSDPNWLAVGTQVWAKYNLNVGTRIASATNQTNNTPNPILEKYCYGNTDAGCTNTDANGIPYGALYQWDEAMQYVTTESAQGICSAGSHIPSDNDWKILEMQLGMTQVQADDTGWRGTDQGTKLKSGGTSGLNMPLAGYRNTAGTFLNLSLNAILWSSSESSANAWKRSLFSGNVTVDRNTYDKGNGFSVRCLGN